MVESLMRVKIMIWGILVWWKLWIIEFEPDRDENISKDDCLQSNYIDMNSFEKWRQLGCRRDQVDEVAVRLDQLLREGKISKDQTF